MLILQVHSAPLASGICSLSKAVYDPEGLLPARGMAGSDLRPLTNIPTAASRRSLVRISVPVWGIILSDPLSIVALVSRYLHQLANRTHAHL